MGSKWDVEQLTLNTWKKMDSDLDKHIKPKKKCIKIKYKTTECILNTWRSLRVNQADVGKPERSDTHSQTEANRVQKTLQQRKQLILSHF